MELPSNLFIQPGNNKSVISEDLSDAMINFYEAEAFLDVYLLHVFPKHLSYSIKLFVTIITGREIIVI
jgi:hypothetical protein